MASEKRLVDTLVYLADTLVKDFDVVDLFYHLVENAPELVDADEAGLLLADDEGELHIMAVTSERVAVVELLQVQRKEGPCFDAFNAAGQVSASLADADSAERWPLFTESVRSAGFGAVTAVPMRLRNHVLGALNIFSTQETPVVGNELRAAQALADIATIAILQHRAASDSSVLIEQLQTALESRIVIEQAKGVIAQALGVEMDDAFTRLRRHTRDRNQTLKQTAQAIVSGELDPSLLPIA